MLGYTSLMFLYITMCGIALDTTSSVSSVSSVASTDTTINLPSDTSTGSGKLLPGLNRNLTPAQQIIYIYGPNQWKTQNNVDLIEKAGNDYLITPGIAAHKLHIRKLTWNKARKACIQEGGHLAIINSNSEEKILIRILEENKASEAWLGIHEFYEEGGWNTIMDESLEATGYSKWTKMYREDVKVPDDNDGSQHCGSLVVNGGLDNRDCNDVYAFFLRDYLLNHSETP